MSEDWHGGKGSAPRPIEDRKKFEDNWDAIFAKPCKECGLKGQHKMDCSVSYTTKIIITD